MTHKTQWQACGWHGPPCGRMHLEPSEAILQYTESNKWPLMKTNSFAHTVYIYYILSGCTATGAAQSPQDRVIGGGGNRCFYAPDATPDCSSSGHRCCKYASMQVSVLTVGASVSGVGRVCVASNKQPLRFWFTACDTRVDGTALRYTQHTCIYSYQEMYREVHGRRIKWLHDGLKKQLPPLISRPYICKHNVAYISHV